MKHPLIPAPSSQSELQKVASINYAFFDRRLHVSSPRSDGSALRASISQNFRQLKLAFRSARKESPKAGGVYLSLLPKDRTFVDKPFVRSHVRRRVLEKSTCVESR
jgi:hypothetical protein